MAASLASYTSDLLESARQQIPSILEDADREPLHQFRVHLRRLRALLQDAPLGLTDTQIKELQQASKKLMGNSGQVRDLDLLPTALRRDPLAKHFLSPNQRKALLTIINKRRHKAWLKLEQQLRSKAFRKQCEQLDVRLKTVLENNLLEEKSVVCRVEEQHARLQDWVKRLPNDPGSNQLHALRIQAKTLRYLAELQCDTNSTCAERFRYARRLQNQLGTFNDQAVQRQLLKQLRKSGAAKKLGLRKPLQQLKSAQKQQEQRLRIEITRQLKDQV